MPPAAHAPVLRRHREAAVRALLPATTERSWVWTIYVEQGDGTAPQLRDVHAEAQRLADDEEAAQPKPEPAPLPPLSPSSGLVMSPRYQPLPERWQILRTGPDGDESWHTVGLGPWVGNEAKARTRAHVLQAEDKGARYEAKKV